MKLRTFIVIMLLFGAILAILSVFESNRAVLDQEITFREGMSLTVGLALVLGVVVGAAVTLLVGVSREVGRMIEHNRLRRASRKSEEIEEEYSKGLIAVLEGHEDEALGHFREVLERDSRHCSSLLKLGEILRGQEKYADAIEFHRKAHHLNEDDTRPLYALVEDYEAKGDMMLARNVLGKIIGINKNSIAARRKLRSLYMKEDNWKQALEAHEQVAKLASSDRPRDAADRQIGSGIRYEIAVERLQEGKVREATSLLRRLLKENDQFIPAHLELGNALLAAGQETETVETWKRGFESTGSPIFLNALEEHYLMREQPLAAIEALKSCVAQARKQTLPRFYLGKLYFRLEMLDDALSVLTSLEGLAAYAPTLHYLLGRIHERRGKFGEAALEYRKVIKEMELIQLEYRCRACREKTMEWSHRCTACGEWNSVEVNFREEISLDELGLAPAPIYTSRP